MNSEDRKKIFSNDYVSAIIEYNRNDKFIKLFENDLKIIIDDKYAIVYFPIAGMPISILTENSYSIIPKMYGLLNTTSMRAMCVCRVQNVQQLSLFGEGVLLGFVDTGIDYLNTAFQNEDHSTRIVSIWDQTIENENPSNTLYFGTEYNRDQINEAIKNNDPYSIVPSKDEIGHGTMLAGIAGGSKDEYNQFQGVVPKAEFVIVKLKQAKQNFRDFFTIPDDAVCYQQDDVMLGFQYLVNVAAKLNRPIAICMGLGTSQGNHDGKSVMAGYISWLGGFIGRAFVIAAGNEGSSKLHYFGTIDEDLGSDIVEFHIGEKDKNITMELWGFSPNTYSFDIETPFNEYVHRIYPIAGESRTVKFTNHDTIIKIDYILIESDTGNPVVLIRFYNTTPGIWKFHVFASGSRNPQFHIWLPLSNFLSDNTYFLHPDPNTTITSPGNVSGTTTVTAYDAMINTIYYKASRGYTFSGKVKPDIAAPGVNVLAPVPGNKYVKASGTSIAAANATGIAAMLLEWGIVRGRYAQLNSNNIQQILTLNAEHLSNNSYPNKVWGYGAVNISNTLINLRNKLQ